MSSQLFKIGVCQVCQGAPARGSNQGPSGGHHAAEEEPQVTKNLQLKVDTSVQVCQICDKSFKSHRTLDNHMKKQHGLAGTPKVVSRTFVFFCFCFSPPWFDCL